MATDYNDESSPFAEISKKLSPILANIERAGMVVKELSAPIDALGETFSRSEFARTWACLCQKLERSDVSRAIRLLNDPSSTSNLRGH